MRTLLISPHLDDAALSCAVRLQLGEITEVVTIFAGLPSADEPSSDWDSLTGASNPRQRMIERRKEDASAWTSISQTFRHWNYVEAQADQVDAKIMSGDIGKHASTFERVLLPAGIGRHPHHTLVRDAALSVLPRETRITLYGELPYAAFYGWPMPHAYLNVEAHWRLELTAIAAKSIQPRLITLTAEQRAWKRALLAYYPSQMEAVGGGSLKLFDTTTLLHHEVEFELS